MFSVLDETLPIQLLRRYDPAVAVARYFGIRPRDWGEAVYGTTSGDGLDRLALSLAARLAAQRDLTFVKLDVIWTSAESAERRAAFHDRTGLDATAHLRCPVIGDLAEEQDWAALFGFALALGWDAVAMSRRKNTLLWFSHDNFVRATPRSLVRGL